MNPTNQTSKLPETAPDQQAQWIYRWNWGAFVFGWLWGIFNRVYIESMVQFGVIALFAGILLIDHMVAHFAKLVCLIVIMWSAIYFGMRGTELAWHKDLVKDVEQFLKRQRGWMYAAPFGIVLIPIFVVAMVYLVMMVLLVIAAIWMLGKTG